MDPNDDDADFTDQQVSTDATLVIEGDSDSSYFAPMDPVVGRARAGRPEIAGGFSPTAEPSTADLRLTVDVDAGVVRMRGTVAGLEDGENAEAVASAVEGVVEAVDETEIEA